MDQTLIREHLDYTVQSVQLNLPDSELYQGKVRDTYRINDLLLLISSDRISAFDHILRQTIPFKGQILNLLAAFFFEHTQDIIQNHVIAIPDANVTIARACQPFPIEFVVRGYLAGHAWRTYSAGYRTLCGQPLPDGLKHNSQFPSPLLTPATKATSGHDEDISREEILAKGIVDESTFDYLAQKALELFERGTKMASERGLILVDTKYEFGQDLQGDLYLIDEVHTPDSSRYFYKESYEQLFSKEAPQRQMSKEFVREWLMQNDFQGLEGQSLPDLPDGIRVEIASRYIKIFELLTGEEFNPNLDKEPHSRIEQAVQSFFQQR